MNVRIGNKVIKLFDGKYNTTVVLRKWIGSYTFKNSGRLDQLDKQRLFRSYKSPIIAFNSNIHITKFVFSHESEEKTKSNESSSNNKMRGRILRNRFLTKDKNVFDYNTWDNIEWDPELLSQAQEKIKINSSRYMDNEDANEFEKNASESWNKFYSIHENKFFKDRNWLLNEFDELISNEDDSNQTKKYILEVGCGVGNTVFPILRGNKDSNYYIYCCDFSSSAIEILKSNPEYDTNRCNAFVCDISNLENYELPMKENQLDLIVMIFVLSAIKPDKMLATVKNLARYLKPGGKILFRDYGLYDMAQLRFKMGQCIEPNFYMRGDGTFVYFFTKDFVDKIFTQCGLVREQNLEDKSLRINRRKQLKMYRVWIQAKYIKPKQ